jgi:hypothetical protein
MVDGAPGTGDPGMSPWAVATVVETGTAGVVVVVVVVVVVDGGATTTVA